jgi:hypothetical protein
MSDYTPEQSTTSARPLLAEVTWWTDKQRDQAYARADQLGAGRRTWMAIGPIMARTG